ncbi:MAG TPA: hypothetical protein DDZ41_07670 [Flavobacterium sp.]|nr:hypothetical protein [Flavobacterium sp.]
MKNNIEISSDLYECLGKIAKPFESPEDVIKRLLVFFIDNNQKSLNNEQTSDENTEQTKSLFPTKEFYKLEVNFYPSESEFKQLLLKTKKAWVKLSYKNGAASVHEWNAYKFSEDSNIRGNLNSGYLRGWREKGIVRADVAIDKNKLP